MANVSSSNGIEKYPRLRFPGFTEPWIKSSVGELLTFTNGKAHEQNVVENGEFVIVNSKFIASEGKTRKYSDRLICELHKNDIVMVMSDVPNGKAMSKCLLIDKDKTYTLNQRICALSGASTPLFYLSQISRNKFYLKFDDGVSQTNLKKEDVLNCPIYNTSENERKRISTFLELVNLRIDCCERLIEYLKKYKRGVLRTIFNSQHEANWKKTKLKDVCTIYDGTHQTPEYQKQGVRFVSVENIGDLQGSNKFISNEAFQRDFKIYPEIGDVLMTRIGDIGRATYVNINEKIAFYVSLALFKCGPTVNGEFLQHYISTDQFQKELWERTLHIAFPKKINTGEIGECTIVLPSVEEQTHIASVCSAIDKKIYSAETSLQLLNRMKAGLLQQLFV